jgi:hypothetical protein
MRRTYISPEFINNKVYGTYNMYEESNFFSAKMLEIEDNINISNEDIIYYQKLSGEQLDIIVESSQTSFLFSASNEKLDNHTIILDPTQPAYQKNNNTRWILEVDLSTIFHNYIFATLKKYRTFEGIKKEMTLEGDVNSAIRKYIEYNVINRYKFQSINLFIEYKDLRDQNILRYKNVWKPTLTEANIFTKKQTETASDDSKVKVFFNQEKSSQEYCFNYFFNILYQKV